jgi:predicted alpha/beta hydrolase family esterase
MSALALLCRQTDHESTLAKTVMGSKRLRSKDASAPRPPSLVLAAAEFARPSLEVSSLLVSGPFLAGAPKGDGHDVIVLPGFACSRRSTFFLRAFLSALGYRAHDWGLGRNLGARTIGASGDRLEAVIDRIGEGGQRPVSLVGHSLGGVVSRHYALARPERVRQVICVGSPFVGDPRAVNPWVVAAHDRVSTVPAAPPPQHMPHPLEVPFTAIWSRSDGVVSPSDTNYTAGERAEAIEVCSSHCGLIAHPAVFYAVADRLAQSLEQWAPFAPTGWRRLAFGDLTSPPEVRLALAA